jgi:hypothetical protein
MAFYKKLATLFIASLANISIAQPHATHSFPRGCEGKGFVFYRDFLVLNEHGNPMFYLIQNHSQQPIELEHFETKENAFMSPKLQAKLAPTHWSAFASDIAQTFFRCYITDNNASKRTSVNCGDYLSVCHYPRVRFAKSNEGSYWASTDKTQQQVIQDSSRDKGIYLRW